MGDSLEVLKTLEADSIDAVITDSPYGIKIMGKKWDYDVPSKELWLLVSRVLRPGGYLLSFGGTRTYHRLVCFIEDAGFEIRDQLQWIYATGFPKSKNSLKGTHEPIVLARKAAEKNNPLNIEDSRIPYQDNEVDFDSICNGHTFGKHGIYGEANRIKDRKLFNKQGRWPTNVLLGEDVAKEHEWSRYFYCPKASKQERQGSDHPTMKPLKLMEYLCRLITPPGGTILDPFAGSGSTGVAALSLGFKFIGIEKEEAYVEIANKRIANG